MPKTLVLGVAVSDLPLTFEYERVTNSFSHIRTFELFERRAEASDYKDDSGTSLDCHQYARHDQPCAEHPATTSKVTHPRRPLVKPPPPIRVHSAALPSCPMPGCGVQLEAKDSAWRGHFRRNHHRELCLTPHCRTLDAKSCKAWCPFPLSDCKSCAGDDRKHGQSRPDAKGAMTIESVGRHLLNVHIKVAYRCPLCGLQNQWRESACVRHIRQCMKKPEYNKMGDS